MPKTPAERGLKLFKSFKPRRLAVEAAIVVVLGSVLTGASLASLTLEYGSLHFAAMDLVTAWAAGLVAALAVRLVVRLHRRWKQAVGRFTAAAALCALAALVGALVVMLPGHCPGGPPWAGRCGVKEAAQWGQVAGLATVLNFMLAGVGLAIFRTGKAVIRDGSSQFVVWFKALAGVWQTRVMKLQVQAVRPKQKAKGRPTPRRADAERARRERLRARS